MFGCEVLWKLIGDAGSGASDIISAIYGGLGQAGTIAGNTIQAIGKIVGL